MSNLKIKKLSDREHILARPSMYIGGVSPEVTESWVFRDGKLSIENLEYSPGLVKIINEVIDNSVDIILKSSSGSKISVEFQENRIYVMDDSVGFYPDFNADPKNQPMVIALGNARAGSNFDDSENIGQIGTNGVGSYVANVFSTFFSARTFHKVNKTVYETFATWENNGNLISSQVTKSKEKKTGTQIGFMPDLARFNMSEISQDVKDAIRTRLACLAYTYPKITFSFNGKEIPRPAKITDWMDIGDCPLVHHKSDNYEVFLVARPKKMADFSFVNGLNIKDGGTHHDIIIGDITKALSSSRLGIQKSDITSTLQLIFVGSQFKNTKFNSQTKEKITNSVKETRDYLGNLDPLVNKVAKSSAIKDYLKATIQAREIRANKTALNKTKKTKIKSDKFLDAQKDRDYLFLVEGDSALGGILPALGRKNIAYYTLRGKPLNAWDCTPQKLSANRELSELLGILHQNDFKGIVFSTDQDLDGIHIRGLLLGFIHKYLPEYKDKTYFLNTPVRAVFKQDKIVRWSYNLEDPMNLKSGERYGYLKGLGSWDTQDLKTVIETDRLDNMLLKFTEDSTTSEYLDYWLGSDSKKRKEFILENDFEIAKV